MADLKVILRPSQQYSAQPPSAQTTNISSARLTALAQTWAVLRDQGVAFHDFLDAKKAPVEVDLSNESGDVKFQFYRKVVTADQLPQPPATSESVPPEASSSQSQAPASPTSQRQAPSVKAPATGMTVVQIHGVTTSDKEAMVILAEAVEKYNVPDDEKFELLCRIRIAKAMAAGQEEAREKLAVARLLAIAIYGAILKAPSSGVS